MPERTGSNWIWPNDQFDPNPARKAKGFRTMLSFEVPRHSPLAKRVAHLANRIFLRVGSRSHGAITPIVGKDNLEILRAIPNGAGNILVGTHPGPLDSHLMFHLVGAAHRGPAVFLMAAEAYFGGPAWRRGALNRLGVIPVARGRKNPEAIAHMAELVGRGWWGGIFPEGEVYFSREVMPMEYGAMRIATETALDAQRRSGSGKARPIFLTPFAHVYFFADLAATARLANNALGQLESHPLIAIRHGAGDFITRLRAAADRLLENKAREYGVADDVWQDDDRFERNRKLQDAVLSDLETEYLSESESGYARRRAMKVRMACFERLADPDLPADERAAIENDVKKTRELILMTPFSHGYREKYDDLETQVEYLRRFRVALDMPPFNFGSQLVHFEVAEPIDVHPIARAYEALESEDARRNLLYERTEAVREIIQAGVDTICARRAGALGERIDVYRARPQ